MSKLTTKTVQLGDSLTLANNFVLSVPGTPDGSLKIERTDGTDILNIGANGKWVAPGLLGVVSEVGGESTGQLIEHGSNSNGRYVRFAGGTQICYAFISISDLASSAINTSGAGGGYRSSQNSVPFPAVFAATPYAGASMTNNGENINVRAFSPATNTWQVVLTTPTTAVASPSGTYGIWLIAVGRWF